jgi:hypothetical protein
MTEAATAATAASMTVMESSPRTAALDPQNISYSAERIIGNGSFGVVFEAKVVETGEVVAIKKVLQDKRFKNRELAIMRLLVKDPHSNIVALKHCFYSQVRTIEKRGFSSLCAGWIIFWRAPLFCIMWTDLTHRPIYFSLPFLFLPSSGRKAGRIVLEFSVGIRARDRVFYQQTAPKAFHAAPTALRQVVSVPTQPGFGPHSLFGNLPP